MKEPEKPWPPDKYEFGLDEFSNNYDPVDIYADRIWILEDSYQIEEYYSDNSDEKIKKPKIPFGEKLTLQHLLDSMPEGAEPKDVHIHWHLPRMAEFFDIKFIYHKPANMKERKAAYKKAQAEYKEKLEIYKKKKDKYDKWSKNNKIKQLEKELNKLKE